MSAPHDLVAGRFGGLTPAVAFTLVALQSDIYLGPWFPAAVAVTTVAIGVPVISGRRNVGLTVRSTAMLDRPHPPIAVDPHEVEAIMAPWVAAKVLCDPDITGPAAMSAVSLFFNPGRGHARYISWRSTRHRALSRRCASRQSSRFSPPTRRHRGCPADTTLKG